MAEPINLNQVRKDRARADKKAKAAENRTKFGRTPLQKALDTAEAEMRAMKLDDSTRDWCRSATRSLSLRFSEHPLEHGVHVLEVIVVIEQHRELLW